MEKISFVIPCYRSEHTISAVVDEIVDTVTAHGGYDYEIILVNDNSPDRVMDVITVLSQFNPRVKGLDLSRNFGQHSAIMAGFTYLTGDIVVCLDDDGQTPANEMFRLIDKLGDVDLVFAAYRSKQHSGFRNFGSKVNDLMARWLLSKPKDLKIMSYFACKRYVVDEVLRYENPY
ncbi:MAG: glycosyltransferase, partial [Ruminococcus sp.]|nr:glycosyltransferase [Ruminococcus sp.]